MNRYQNRSKGPRRQTRGGCGVRVRVTEGEQVIVLEIHVHPEDLGKVIGRQGRIIDSIRVILVAAGMKLQKRIKFEILEGNPPG